MTAQLQLINIIIITLIQPTPSHPLSYPSQTNCCQYPGLPFGLHPSQLKVKSSPQDSTRKPRGGIEVQIYSFFNIGAIWGGGQRHAPAALPPVKTRYRLYRRLGGPQDRSGLVRKISPPTGIRSPGRPARSKSLYRLSYPGSPPF